MQLKLSSPQIWLATQAVDFRLSIDGLSQLLQSQFNLDLKAGIFIFYNKTRKKIKILTWHQNGFVLVYKRLESGCFSIKTSEEGLMTVDERQLSWLLAGLDWVSMSAWKELEFDDYF
jgi:transposase